MALSVRCSGSIVPADYAVFPSAAAREVSCVSMAFKRCLRIPYDSRDIDKYIRPSSNTVCAIWLYVQYKVCDLTGDVIDLSCCGSGRQEMAANAVKAKWILSQASRPATAMMLITVWHLRQGKPEKQLIIPSRTNIMDSDRESGNSWELFSSLKACNSLFGMKRVV